MRLTRTQTLALALLTLFWGANWPVMKLAVDHFPPMSFRALSMLLGLPCLAIGLLWCRVPFALPRRFWVSVAGLALTNMVVWHVALMLALPHLSSGRAAILGYTMPVFSALWGLMLYGQRFDGRQLFGVASAGLGVLLLLWHEFSRLSGAPVAAATLLSGAAVWALGTQQLRRAALPVPTLTIAFWMTAITTGVVCMLAALTESQRWAPPDRTTWSAIAYNAVLIFGFCHAAWFALARALPPVASSVSVSLIPVLGLLSGAWWLGEELHWQDGAAILSIVAAIVAVLWPVQTKVSCAPAADSRRVA
ncbi:MAG: EamA family transporter [Aquincola sp.]|nr:EamA family transporter [Aquincola sp.]|tara:strand:+ start:3623 stop:4540 length:918 start_codon:yes stop_codon:yes gene_type:complete